MAETTPINNGATDPLKDVHSPEFWEYSWANIQNDLRNLDSLPSDTPVVDRLRQEVGVLIAITLHQERVLALLARDTATPAPKPPRKPRTTKVRVEPDPFDGHQA